MAEQRLDSYGIAKVIESSIPRLLEAGPLCKEDKHDLLEAMRRSGMGYEVRLIESLDLKQLRALLYGRVLR